MPITQIGRQIQSVSVSSTYSLTDPNIEQIVANATSAGFTITLYNDTNSGAYHRVVVKVSDSDVSGNTVTIVDAAGVFSTTLSSTSAAVELETDPAGNWLAVATFPTTNAATAISAANSAGLRASTADSKAVSDSVVISTNLTTANSTAASNSLNISVADSKAVSDSVVISTLTTTSDSKAASNSLNISVADSKAVSDSVVISTLTTTTNSKITSQSLILSVTTSTANSG